MCMLLHPGMKCLAFSQSGVYDARFLPAYQTTRLQKSNEFSSIEILGSVKGLRSLTSETTVSFSETIVFYENVLFKLIVI